MSREERQKLLRQAIMLLDEVHESLRKVSRTDAQLLYSIRSDLDWLTLSMPIS